MARSEPPPQPTPPVSSDPFAPKYPDAAFADLTDAQRVECWYHFPSFCLHFLKIWTKADANNQRHLVPLRWNKAQRKFWPLRTARNYHLKSRQVGWTTIEEAEDFHICMTVPAASVQLLAHSEELTEDMRERVHVFLDNLPKEFTVEVANDTKNGFKFTGIPGMGLVLNSRLGLRTVGGKHKGIGKTLDKFHATELSRWEGVSGGVGNFIVTAVQALPPTVPVTLETTPNGMGHPSYALWKKAKSGEWSFTPHFMPWWYDETAMRDVPEDFAVVDEDESWLLDNGAVPANIIFRREKIREMDTPEYDGKSMFNQEYPSDERTCFLKGGKNAFPVDRLIEQEEALEREQQHWAANQLTRPLVGHLALAPTGSTTLFSERQGGPLQIWDRPVAGVQYAIGVDVGKGIPNGDFSTCCVIRADTMEQVAEYQARVIPEIFRVHVRLLGYLYSTALVAVEKNDVGYLILSSLVEESYPNLYTAQKTAKGYAEDTNSYGWHNNVSTRGLAIAQTADFIWERRVKIRSTELIEQLSAFTENDQGKYCAPKSMHDDLAMAFMIAVWAVNHGIYDPETPWVPGQTESDIEEIIRYNKQFEADPERYEDDINSEVALFLR